MTTLEIASQLVDMCRNGKIEEAKEELFAPDLISIEPREGLLQKKLIVWMLFVKKRNYSFPWWTVFMVILFPILS